VTDFDKALELLHRAVEGAPDDALAATVELQAFVDLVQALQVKRARDKGYSWREIAHGLGVSVSAAHKRFSSLVDYAKGSRRVRPPQHKWIMAASEEAEW
jgi:hypothetical protein